MTEFNEREYQAVIFGALLHDIGKFYQRALGKGKGDHQQLGMECYEKYFAETLSTLLSVEERDVVINAINNHHHYAEFITTADGLSAGTDRIELADYETGATARERLRAVFQKISLGNHTPIDEYRYNLKPLSLKKEDIFPQKIIDNTILTGEYEELWNNYSSELAKLPTNNLSLYINSLYHLLWKYTWCVPSAVYKSEPDISLFDHLKTTAAIAGCLYVNKMSSKKEEKEFLVFASDFSGIQNFIYKIARVQGVGGIAKRLRGRSFYLSLLQEMMGLYILRQLHFSMPHMLMCGGGRFEMLLPNTPFILRDLNNMSAKINKWLIEEYLGELGLVTAYVEANQESIKSYSDILKVLDEKLSIAKKNKYIDNFNDTNFWIESKDIKRLIRVCRSCNTTLVEKGINDEICDLCGQHKKIGEQLPESKTDYIAYLSQPNNSVKGIEITFGEFGSVYLLPERTYNDKLFELQELISIQRVNDTAGIFKFIGNVAPVAREDFEQKTEEDEQDGKNVAKEGNVLTFETMADMSVGDKRIGVLKMDVDYLGIIFAIGLIDETKERQKSISRVASLSRSMDWFFAGYLNEICKIVFEKWKDNAHQAGWNDKADKIENIFYIVYSGGDDLLIIGPWSEIPKLAKKIRDEFKEYTCNNSDINLSAGIYLCKPKFPINISSTMAGEELGKSKDSGRSRITFFGDTVMWNESDSECGFNELLDFGEFLYDALTAENANNKLPRGFVHGLLKKHKQYKGGQDPKFIPAVIYQLTRNVRNDELRKVLKSKLITDKNKYFKNLKIPASYALLKSRKGE
jgi:CRISPR-associated protein Csm1